MDPIRRDDVEEMRRATPEEKARQVLDLMETGIRLKRTALRARRPDASEAELEHELQAWLDDDERCEPPTVLETELRRAADALVALGRRFALVGGIAVSIRGEVRFTRDVDLAVQSASNDDTESLVRDLRAAKYEIAAIVGHERLNRIAIVRLRSRARIHVDLLTASSGIETEIIDGASVIEVGGAGALPVAQAEDLLATKVLSMSERRLQDRMDARALVLANPALDLLVVRARLAAIHARGCPIVKQDLGAKLEALLADIAAD